MSGVDPRRGDDSDPALDAAPAFEAELATGAIQLPPSKQPPTRSLGRASALLASGTIVSRVLGFARTAVLAAAIGQTASSVADAFALSNQLPNNVYALVAGGLLSAVLIPQIVRASKNPDGGQEYVNKIVTLGLVVFAAVTLVATIGAPTLVKVYAQSASGGSHGFDANALVLATTFAYWCLPQIFFYAVYSLLSEILNARGVFGPFTWAPVINNVIGVLGLAIFLVAFGTRNIDVGQWSTARTVVLAGTTTLGVAVQAGFLLFFWKRAGLTYRPDFVWRGVGLGSTGRAAGWMFALILVTQLAGVVQSRAASLGSSVGASNATISNAWLLFFLPHGIVTVSIATAYFTSMTGHAERGDVRAVRNNLSESMRTIGMFIVFATIALAVLAVPFSRFYETSYGDIGQMAAVILAYLPGLVFFSMLFLLQRVFFAFHDQRTVFFLQLIQSGIFVVAVLLCTVLVAPVHIAVAIAIVTSVAGTAQTIVALRLVHNRLGGLDGRWVTRRHVQYLVFSAIAGVVGLFVVSALGGYDPSGFGLSGRIPAILTVIIAGAVMALVYVALLTAARIPELSAMTRPIFRRLRRR